MEFMLITIGIMTCSSLVVYKLSSHFNLEINPQALAFCGIASLAVNFSAIKMSSYLSPSHYILLAGLILLASSAATYYNQYLIHHHTAVPKATPSPIIMADTIPADEAEAPDTLDNAEIIENAEPAEDIELTENIEHTDDVEQVEDIEHTEALETIPDDTENTVNDVADNTDNIIEETSEADTEAEESSEEPAEDIAESVEEDIEETISETPEEKETDVLNNVSEDIADTNDTVEIVNVTSDTAEAVDDTTEITDDVSEADETVETTEVIETTETIEAIETIEENKTDVRIIPSPEVIAEVASKNNMDDLLDFAYEQNLAENHDTALYAYKEALERYSEDSYAPFIAIEMINICKSIGAYAEAIDGYKNAMLLPSVKDNPQMQKEFKNGIIYIECIIEILGDKNMPDTPLGNIPPQIMKEIELIFAIRKTK
ncbi:MAG: hypothetical protein SO022_11140 [Selenomonadaceae bacterium]|nr:hypothetical protein [Selenomonadaceae bacterium]